MFLFFKTLKTRNRLLYYFGFINLVAAICCIAFIGFTSTTVMGVNAWIKPFKFFVSTVIFCFTMGWIMVYLERQNKVKIYSWIVMAVLAFENIYIAYQAGRGELSHFNIFSVFHGIMFSLMGIAISILTLWTAYIGYLFFRQNFKELPPAYVWGIRLGILFFVIFAFEGGVMASRLAHTVGAPDGSAGLPVVNWSKNYGDLRIAHFIGMHALQVLPFTSYYFIKNPRFFLVFAMVYFLLTSFFYWQAMQGRSFAAIM